MRASDVRMGRASSRQVRTATIAVAIVAFAAVLLYTAGRSPICPCGTVKLWHGTVQSPENSQQLADWYSLSHIVHGLLFYAAGWLALRRLSLATRFLIATAIESAWEVVENSPAMIERYRAVTISWGYSGDSIVNSLSDIAMMMLGFWLASRLRPWMSVATVIALELIALAAIRDNLTLNLLMLIAPSNAIMHWQAG